ncbi:MAG: phytanoyl-CoA dioxygenase family protein [Microthrixaceae bacterium]|nr:phytanoyl-CoA dioxygenase family protein [Microthrixaceae bacterium]
MTEITRLAATDAQSLPEVLNRDGVVIVEGLLDEDLLARFNAELDGLLDQAALGKDQKFINDGVAWFFGDKTRHVTGLASKSRIFAEEIRTLPPYMAACDAILGPNCSDYSLNLAHVLDRGPGGDQQMIHRDEDVWIHFPQPHPEIELASVIALIDFTAENGATRVVPGSHLWDRDRQATDDDLVPAVMDAGSAVVYLGSTLHAGGGNTTDIWRRAMHVSYCLGWLRAEENPFLTTPMDMVRSLPRRNQQLLGFGAHDAIDVGGGYLGVIELQDPVELLANGVL